MIKKHFILKITVFFAVISFVMTSSYDGISAPVVPPPIVVPEIQVLPVPAIKKICKERPCFATGTIEGEMRGVGIEIFTKWLKDWELTKPDAFVFFINSDGGDFEVASAMARMLVGLDVPVYCVAGEKVASSAFWVYQACDHRVANIMTLMMTHEIYVVIPHGTSLTRRELLNIAEDLRVSTDVMVSMIAARMKMPKAKIIAKLAEGDWRMTAEEGLVLGAVDEIFTGSFDAYVKKMRMTWKDRKQNATTKPK